MKRFLFLSTLILTLFIPAFTQEDAAEEKAEITQCETLEEVKAAQNRGDRYIEFKNRYYVRVGLDYHGPYRSFKTAENLLKQYEKKAEEEGISLDHYLGKDVLLNPQLMIYPFMEVVDEETIRFEVPKGDKVNSTKVMLHPEPFLFENVKFGKIRFPEDEYFAVTGKIVSRSVVPLATDEVKLSVGAAVVNKEGDVLWKQYGDTNEASLEFKCIAPIENNNNPPELLLIFSIADGKIDKMLKPFDSIPDMDVDQYDYHVLNSAALEMANNWFPPLKEDLKAEYEKELNKYQQERMSEMKEKMRGGKP